MVKQLAKKILPKAVFNYLESEIKKFKSYKRLKRANSYDFKNYLESSDIRGLNSANKMIGLIIREYHAVEKGLIMPEFRLGFGKDRVISLCNNCCNFIDSYGTSDSQLKHAVEVINEYVKVHEDNNYKLSDDVLDAIKKLQSKISDVSWSTQRVSSNEEYFSKVKDDFKSFSNSRASVRNYTKEEVTVESIEQALLIARNTPSACNRQSARTYVYTDKTLISRILEVQGGNRGFGHLANKVVIVTSDNNLYSGVGERNQAYVDGGMYAMNLLYALHYNKIAACILNCSTTPEKDIKLRQLTGIKDSEVFIAMVSCGIPPEDFKIAASKRYDLEVTNKVIK